MEGRRAETARTAGNMQRVRKDTVTLQSRNQSFATFWCCCDAYNVCCRSCSVVRSLQVPAPKELKVSMSGATRAEYVGIRSSLWHKKEKKEDPASLRLEKGFDSRQLRMLSFFFLLSSCSTSTACKSVKTGFRFSWYAGARTRAFAGKMRLFSNSLKPPVARLGS